MTISPADSSPARSGGGRRVALWALGGLAVAVVVLVVIALVVVDLVDDMAGCEWASDRGRDRLESAMEAVDVADRVENRGVSCDYGTLVGVLTYSDSAATGDAVEADFLSDGWLRKQSANRAFCLPGTPYMYAVISPFGESTFWGEGVAAVEFLMDEEGEVDSSCP